MNKINDISFWQVKADFSIMRTKSDGVILRAGQGSWVDKCFKQFRKDASGVIPFGSYWYYDNSVNPKRQAELYVNTIKDNPGILGAWLDLEQERIGDFKSYKFWYDFCERFKQLLPDTQLGIYTRKSYFDPLVPNGYKYFSQYPLWLAQYKTLKPDIPKGWTDWLIWQWTDEGDGHAHGVQSREIDMNHYKGDIIVNESYVIANFDGKDVIYKEEN